MHDIILIVHAKLQSDRPTEQLLNEMCKGHVSLLTKLLGGSLFTIAHVRFIIFIDNFWIFAFISLCINNINVFMQKQITFTLYAPAATALLAVLD